MISFSPHPLTNPAVVVITTGELIPIQEREGKQAVSARDLHAFLESKQQFADWVKNRIDKYDLVENQDYVVFQNSMKNSSGGRSLTEYALTIDAAKELSMVEGNEKGKQARKYFITCEKKLKEVTAPSHVLSTAEMFAQAAGLMLELEKAQKEQAAELASIYLFAFPINLIIFVA